MVVIKDERPFFPFFILTPLLCSVFVGGCIWSTERESEKKRWNPKDVKGQIFRHEVLVACWRISQFVCQRWGENPSKSERLSLRREKEEKVRTNINCVLAVCQRFQYVYYPFSHLTCIIAWWTRLCYFTGEESGIQKGWCTCGRVWWLQAKFQL